MDEQLPFLGTEVDEMMKIADLAKDLGIPMFQVRRFLAQKYPEYWDLFLLWFSRKEIAGLGIGGHRRLPPDDNVKPVMKEFGVCQTVGTGEDKRLLWNLDALLASRLLSPFEEVDDAKKEKKSVKKQHIPL